MLLLYPFQIVDRFNKSRYIIFDTYLETVYIKMHSKIYISRFAKTIYNLKQNEDLQFETEWRK
jgi:hypothetical protein